MVIVFNFLLLSDTVQKLNYKKYVVNSRLRYYKPHSTKVEQSFSDEISNTLSNSEKYIHPKFFYDQKGSQLFEQICELPEYYPTRTEIEILKKIRTKIVDYVDNSFKIVELGSGSSNKTNLILDVFDEFQGWIDYFPIDISDILTESSEILLRNYSNLHITGIVDTYEEGLDFIEQYDTKNNLILFLGSSFGNFIPSEGEKFLHKINSIMKTNDLFLIGLDLVKDKSVLESAYNDKQGITAQFNLNVLSRINDELDADFDLDNFEHYAVYNESKQRIEMYLRSLVNQTITISKSNISITLSKNELIHTEYSHKYTIPQIENLMNKTGFKLQHIWTDENKFYALILVSKKS